MRWLRFAVATFVIWMVGTMVLFGFAMMECFPHSEECVSDKQRDALIILIVTIGLWIGSTFLIFRKRPTD